MRPRQFKSEATKKANRVLAIEEKVVKYSPTHLLVAVLIIYFMVEFDRFFYLTYQKIII
jgi:hypothetical protein